jgi:hypothetical protein
MKALKVLIPTLLAAGAVVVPLEAVAAGEKAPNSYSETWSKTRSFRDTAYTRMPAREHAITRSTALDTDGLLEGDASKVPELSGSAAGASLALLGGGLLAMAGRRKQKSRAE